MNQELAAPVKGIANAFHRGTVLTKRICRFVQNTPTTYMLETLNPAQALERSLARSGARIRDAYAHHARGFGRRYTDTFSNNHAVTNRLHALTINLLEQLNGLEEYMDDPNEFDLGQFPYLQRESERCCDQALIALDGVCQQLRDSGFHEYQPPQGERVSQLVETRVNRVPQGDPVFQLVEPQVDPVTQHGDPQVTRPQPPQDDRNLLPSARLRPATRNRGGSDASPREDSPTLGFGILVQTDASQHNQANSPEHSQESFSSENAHRDFAARAAQLPPVHGPPQTTAVSENNIDNFPMPDALKLVNKTSRDSQGDSDAELIKKEEVSRQLSAVDEFLARRRISRELFHDELSRLSVVSVNMSPTSTHPSITISPSTQSAPNYFDSSAPNSRPDSAILNTVKESVVPNGPPVPSKNSQWSIPSPIENDDSTKHPLRLEPKRKDSDLIYRAPDSPPLSQGHQSGTDEWGSLGLAPTLRVPGYGDNVEDGIEVVNQVMISDPGLILADEEDHKIPTPATSVQSVDHAVRHDSSFYAYGGFCDGAKMTVRGVGGTMKDVKKPGGMYLDVIVVRCSQCSFEVGYNNFYRDKRLEKSGIIVPPNINDMRYRTRFLTKCHVKTKMADSPFFACAFCIDQNKTLEDQDATIFFSAAQYLTHLQKHPRPLREVEGIKVVYGPQPESAVDFDLHFLSMEARVSPTADIAARLAAGGTGIAIVDHRPSIKGFKAIDPTSEHRPTLRFAIGARIVGITYPPNLHGDWCSGYHDSVKALFPSAALNLESPSKDDIIMDSKSTLAATAKWEHRPAKDAGWLSFGKKERITHIAYPYQEFWCWSGMNAKGKWGIFPREFVDGLVDTGPADTAPRPGFTSHASFPLTQTTTGGSATTATTHTSKKFGIRRKTSNNVFSVPFVRRAATVKSQMSVESAESA